MNEFVVVTEVNEVIEYLIKLTVDLVNFTFGLINFT